MRERCLPALRSSGWCGLSGRDIFGSGSSDVELEEVVLIVTPQAARLYCPRALYAKLGGKLSRAPKLTEFKTDLEGGAPPLRPVASEDLLNRPVTILDRDGMARMVSGKRVLLTGAAGFVGFHTALQMHEEGDVVLGLDNFNIPDASFWVIPF